MMEDGENKRMKNLGQGRKVGLERKTKMMGRGKVMRTNAEKRGGGGGVRNRGVRDTEKERSFEDYHFIILIMTTETITIPSLYNDHFKL